MFHLIHPGAMDGRVVHSEPRMALKPLTGQLAFVDADVVADDVDGLDVLRCVLVDGFEQSDGFYLALAAVDLGEHLAGLDVERGEEIPDSLALVLMLEENRSQSGSSWLRGGRPSPWLNRREFVQ